MKTRIAVLLAAVIVAPHAFAQGDGYPNKPIKLVVPFTAGSASDTAARIVAEEVRSSIGTIVVDNRPGANGIIGSNYVAKSPADGYTLLLTSSSTHSGIEALFKRPGYDPIKDFVHISRIATIPMVLVTRPDAPYKTAKDMALYAQKNHLRYGYGSGSAQIAAATFSQMANVPSDAIPYKSQPPAVTDLLGGQIDYMVADTSVVMSFLHGGKLDGLAITSPRRLPELPNVPTMAEAGYKNFDLVVWVGLAAPAGTPAAVVEKWNKAVNDAVARPPVVEKLAKLGMVAAPASTRDFAAFTVAQRGIWTSRATKAGVEQQ
ncbi:ABC transporter substrate-binding protein [Cupriavidus sp. HMR-1]|uniref:Bug family tripartite tricarboxylate transporter substrate binding protein n=1 Tax=Cupriavidus sp. HMR-1 TaxID=1249621 RepID=UPI0002A32837|nr:tripartite tricarboxylate transporter substrate binding protein [Cupriavidus sp. HMR-1]EKZ95504.1 ABC transporter substrate-binding protein [Cupriavidus sp. HMR-1]